jgi:hypothetical protein
MTDTTTASLSFPKLSPDDLPHREALQKVLRSALCPVRDETAPRRLFTKPVPIFAGDGIQVTLMGEELDQTDLDVLRGIISVGDYMPVRRGRALTEVSVSAPDISKFLGLDDSDRRDDRRDEAIARWCAGVIDLSRRRHRFFGRILGECLSDEITRRYVATVNQELIVFLGRARRASLV